MTLTEASVWVTGAATLVTALATAVLAWVTWLLWKATRRMAAVASEPYVVATLEPNRWSFIHMDLVIENTGTGPAFDVQVEFDPPLVRDRHDEARAALNRVSVIRPRQTLRDYIDRGSDLLPNSYRVSLSWKAAPDASVRATNGYDLNMEHFRGLVQLGGGDPLVQLAQEVKKLREAVEAVFRGSQRLGVDTFTQQDRNRDQAALEAAFERMEAQAAAPARTAEEGSEAASKGAVPGRRKSKRRARPAKPPTPQKG